MPRCGETAKEREAQGSKKGGRTAGRGGPKAVDRSVQQIAPSNEASETPKTVEIRAKEAGVNKRYIQLADKLVEERPEMAQAVLRGEKTLTQVARQLRKEEIIAQVSLPTAKYRVIYADPPWSYGNTQPDYHTEQRDHYPVMSLADLCAMDVKGICEDNAVLFLWVTSPMLEECFQVIKGWGFRYASSFVWDKIKHNMGHYNSVRHEFLLVCVRGSCQPDVPKLFDSVLSIERTEHSRKPLEVYDIIETLYPYGKRLELFARGRRDGWDAWGNEAPLS